MVEIVIFTLVGLTVYFGAARLLNYIEIRRGERFEYRQAIYFVIVLALTLGFFEVINRFGN